MWRSFDHFIQSGTFIQSLPRWLWFCFSSVIFFVAGGVSIIIGFVAGDVILSLFTDNLTVFDSYIGAFLLFIFVGVQFSIFTYGVVRAEKSTLNPALDHIRHVFFFYFFLVILLIQSYDILHLAFIPGYDPLTQELADETLEANLSVMWLSIYLTIIIANLIALFIFRNRTKISP